MDHLVTPLRGYSQSNVVPRVVVLRRGGERCAVVVFASNSVAPMCDHNIMPFSSTLRLDVARRKHRRRQPEQLALPLAKPTWGGRRKGAGRKRGDNAGTPHKARPRHKRHQPVHVTLRLLAGLPSLRRADVFPVVKRALAAGSEREGFALVHYSVQSNHLHLIVEADDSRALSGGVAGLAIRVARRLNAHLARRGRVFAGRFHAHALKTPREVRNALAYVLLNHRHHRASRRGGDAAFDPCSSSACFDGWAHAPPRCTPDDAGVCAPTTWLLAKGWRRHRLLRPTETPGA